MEASAHYPLGNGGCSCGDPDCGFAARERPAVTGLERAAEARLDRQQFEADAALERAFLDAATAHRELVGWSLVVQAERDRVKDAARVDGNLPEHGTPERAELVANLPRLPGFTLHHDIEARRSLIFITAQELDRAALGTLVDVADRSGGTLTLGAHIGGNILSMQAGVSGQLVFEAGEPS